MCKAECEFSVKITPYIDGELSGEESFAVSEHLKNCEECGALYNRLKRVVDITGELPHLKPENSAYIQNLRGRIDRPSVGWLPSSLSSFGRQLAFAGASLLLIAGVYFGAEHSRPGGNDGSIVADASTKGVQLDSTISSGGTGSSVTDAADTGKTVLVASKPGDVSQKNDEEGTVSPQNLSVNQPKFVGDSGNDLIASVVVDSGTSSPDEEDTYSDASVSEQPDNSVLDTRTSAKTTSGIDWDAVDLRSALVNSESSSSGSASMVYPPVYSSYEQVAGLYGNLASDYSSSDVQFDDSTVKSGGIVILKVHNQTEFWPSLYKHLLDDEDYRVRFVAYNQYEESKIVIDYSGSDSFEAGFTSFASRVQSLSSVVGLLIIKTGEPDSSVLTLTIRPSEKSSSH